MSKKCLIYANCQGEALGHFLHHSPQFRAEYSIEYLANFLMISEKKSFDSDQIDSADLLIYQPLNDDHGPFSTRSLLTLLPERCRSLSFPYIYNDALWPLFKDGQKIAHSSIITDLLDQGASPLDIAFQFLTLKIDFRFQQRWERSLRILTEKEALTDVKVVDFILHHYQKKRLFLTQNHPATPLLLHAANQILASLNYPLLLEENHPHPNEAQLPGLLPHSPYDINHHQLIFADDWHQFSWRRHYLQNIMETILSRYPQKNFRYHLNRFTLKMVRSLSSYF